VKQETTLPLTLKRRILHAAHALIPLRIRMRVAAWLTRNGWFPGAHNFAEALIRDLGAKDPMAFHKFAWEHHLALYGRWYDSLEMFHARKLNGTREANHLFMDDLTRVLSELGFVNDSRIQSVLDVGCSLGYVLRQLETDMFPDAESMVGIDIDREATRVGRQYLQGVGSRVELIQGDLAKIGTLISDRKFDFSLATGSLSYLSGDDASAAVGQILDRTRKLVALVGLANRSGPNRSLIGSAFVGERGSLWVHNFESMINQYGWKVVDARWRPPQGEDNQGIYFVFASPLSVGGTTTIQCQSSSNSGYGASVA
jgi:SAM-dependent methyltransferase